MQINHGSFRISTGSELLFSACDSGDDMWTGIGDRFARRFVTFPQSYGLIPAVQVSISMFDFDQGANQRADLYAEDVTREGFTLVFKTWGDTRVARLRADWLAIGCSPDVEPEYDV